MRNQCLWKGKIKREFHDCLGVCMDLRHDNGIACKLPHLRLTWRCNEKLLDTSLMFTGVSKCVLDDVYREETQKINKRIDISSE